jgi:hypothetical protein
MRVNLADRVFEDRFFKKQPQRRVEMSVRAVLQQTVLELRYYLLHLRHDLTQRVGRDSRIAS